MTKTEFTAAKLANLGRATTDPRLKHLDVRLFCYLMISVADGQTGIIRRKQADLAEALRTTRRAVQLRLVHLVECDYLEPIGKRPGGYINGYKMVTRERRTGVRLAAADHEKANLRSPKGERAFAPILPFLLPQVLSLPLTPTPVPAGLVALRASARHRRQKSGQPTATP